MSYVYVSLALLATVYLVLRYWQHTKPVNKIDARFEEKQTVEKDPLAAYRDIKPLHDFHWESTPPLKLRPFKPKYHLTMGLETIPLSDLLQMDNTYLSRIKLRREIMDSHPEATLACNKVAEPAALELYTWLTGTYLPKRFPTCFALVNRPENTGTITTDKDDYTHLLNKTTSEPIPLHQSNPLTALRVLSSHIDTDFLILLPSTPASPSQTLPPQQPPTYTLQAFATTFPSGFNTLSKLSLPLASIHAPVPSYASKLEKSMDRFFARLETGKLVRRANWTVTTSPDLFVQSGTHMHSGESSNPDAGADADADAAQAAEDEARAIASARAALGDKPIGDFRLRCELQTLHRLRETGALVFAFKTYTYGLEEVKAEGGGAGGEALAEATEGFARGSAPGMSVYKREAVWGDRVREFLRS